MDTINDLKQKRKLLIAQSGKLASRIYDLEAERKRFKRIEVEMPVGVDMKRIQNEDGTWSKWEVLGTIPPRVVDAQRVVDVMGLEE